MKPEKLAFLVNDTFDAIERSKIGDIYLKDAEGKLLKTPEGCPISNAAAVQIFNACLQTQIVREMTK